MAASSQSAAVTSAATDKIPAGIGAGPAAPIMSRSSLLLNVSMSTWETCAVNGNSWSSMLSCDTRIDPDRRDTATS